MNKKNIIAVVIILLISMIFIGIYFVYTNFFKNQEMSQLRNYKVNEYIPTYISDEDMAEIYFNDYITKVINFPNKAYLLLNEDYRNSKFKNYDDYNNYISKFDIIAYEVKRYFKVLDGDYIYFGVYDLNDNLYIFKTKGVLQYEVYLDKYNLDIGLGD